MANGMTHSSHAAAADRAQRKPGDRGECQGLQADTPMAATIVSQATKVLVRAAVLTELADAIGPQALSEAATLFRDSAATQVKATRAALAAGDLATVARHAHALKSPAAMLGADALSQTMALIERAAMARDGATAMAAAEGLEALLDQSLASLDRALAAAAA